VADYELIQAGRAVEATLGVVIPSFNAGAVSSVVDEIFEAAREAQMIVEVHVVDDGSVQPVTLGERDGLYLYRGVNQGKGAALRFGLAQSKCGAVGFLDADGDYDPRSLFAMASLIGEQRADCVVGRRKVAGVGVRRVFSWLFRLWVCGWQGIRVETQAGIKVFSRAVCERVLPSCVVNGFAFDVEILARAQRDGFTRVLEVPVEVRLVFAETSVTPRHVLHALFDVARVGRCS